MRALLFRVFRALPRDPRLDLLGRELRLTSGAPALVVRAQHLVEVLGLERLAALGQLAR